MEQNRRHKRLFALQAKIAGVILGVILGLSAFSGVVQGVQHVQQSNEHALAEERADFWRIIANDQAPNSANVEQKLARDLRDRLGEIDPNASSFPVEITEFQAGANEYGGVTEALGFNPFDNSGKRCVECGPLNLEMLSKLGLIQNGQVDKLINSELAETEPQPIMFTSFGVPNVVWFGLVYLGAGTAAIVLAVRKDSKREGYRPEELNWHNTGGTLADHYKRLSKVISPLYFYTILPLKRRNGNDFSDALRQTGLEADYEELQRFLRDAKQLPPAERDEVIDQVAKLLDQIHLQVRNYVGDDLVFVEDDADHLRARIAIKLPAIAENLNIRDAAHKELNELNSPMEDDEFAKRVQAEQRALDNGGTSS